MKKAPWAGRKTHEKFQMEDKLLKKIAEEKGEKFDERKSRFSKEDDKFTTEKIGNVTIVRDKKTGKIVKTFSR